MPKLMVFILALLAANGFADVNLSLSLDTLDNPSNVRLDPGQEQTYVYGYATSAVVDARLIHPIPPGARLVRWSDPRWSCAQDVNAVRCTRRLDPAESYYDRRLALTIAAPSDEAGLVFDATARIESDESDPAPYDNEAHVGMVVYHLLTVSTSDDFGAGSLRDTLARANDECKGTPPCHVVFAEPMRIVPRSPLPAITGCDVLVDGGGYRHDTLNRSFDAPRRVEISGEDAGAADGLVVASACGINGKGPRLQGLDIHSFAGNGIAVISPAEPFAEVAGCSISGTLRGISVDAPKAWVSAYDCLIVNNARSGIAYWRGNGGALQGNLIGVRFGATAAPNGASGVFVNAGWVSSSGNAIEYNHDFGIGVGPGAAHCISDHDYIALNGGIAVDWGLDGPTAVDDSARMPPVPVLTDAVSDGRVTTISGYIPRAVKNFVAVSVAIAGGDYQGGIEIAGNRTQLFEVKRDNTPFELRLRGDFRGRTITAKTLYQEYYDFVPVDSSEFSAGMIVR